jgi:GTP-binding protein
MYTYTYIHTHNQVNPVEAKQLTNIRAAGSDEKIFLAPPRQFSLEEVIGPVLKCVV